MFKPNTRGRFYFGTICNVGLSHCGYQVGKTESEFYFFLPLSGAVKIVNLFPQKLILRAISNSQKVQVKDLVANPTGLSEETEVRFNTGLDDLFELAYEKKPKEYVMKLKKAHNRILKESDFVGQAISVAVRKLTPCTFGSGLCNLGKRSYCSFFFKIPVELFHLICLKENRVF